VSSTDWLRGIGASSPRGPGFQFGCGAALFVLPERVGAAVLKGIGSVMTGGGVAFRVIVAQVIGAGTGAGDAGVDGVKSETGAAKGVGAVVMGAIGTAGSESGVEAATEGLDDFVLGAGRLTTGASARKMFPNAIMLTPVDLILGTVG